MLEAALEKAEAALARARGKEPRKPARNRGHLPTHLPRVERVIEPTSTLCPVRRDLRRHLQEIQQGPLHDRVLDALWLVGRLLEQGPKSKDRVYSLHEPEVDCISKGKARVRYEFGTKVSLVTSLDGGFVVGARSFPGNPYNAPLWRQR